MNKMLINENKKAIAESELVCVNIQVKAEISIQFQCYQIYVIILKQFCIQQKKTWLFLAIKRGSK